MMTGSAVPEVSVPPCGAITSACMPAATTEFCSAVTAARSLVSSATIPMTRPSVGHGRPIWDRAGLGSTSAGVTVAAGAGRPEALGDLRGQVGVDVGQHLQHALLDGLLVALAQLERERVGEVVALHLD